MFITSVSAISRGGWAAWRRSTRAWYLRAYPDVAQALRDNQVASASQHFYLVGGGEGRSPNADQLENAMRWKSTLRGD